MATATQLTVKEAREQGRFASWDEFHAANNNEYYTPSFHPFQDAIIADESLSDEARLIEAIQRHSWSNRCCFAIIATSKGDLVMTQTHFARLLGLSDGWVSELMQRLVARGLIEIKGKKIFPLSNSNEIRSRRQKATQSKKGKKRDKDYENEGKNAKNLAAPKVFRIFSNDPHEIEGLNKLANEDEKYLHFLEKFEPVVVEGWGILEELRAKYRASPEYLQRQEEKKARRRARMGKDIEANGKRTKREQGANCDFGNPKDSGSESLGEGNFFCGDAQTFERPIFIEETTQNSLQPSSSFSQAESQNETHDDDDEEHTAAAERKEVAAALAEFVTPDDEAVRRLIADCRSRAADATTAEIVHFVRLKGRKLSQRRNVENLLGLLLVAVPRCFEGASLELHRAEARAREERQMEPNAVAEMPEQLPEPHDLPLAEPTNAPRADREISPMPRKPQVGCPSCNDMGTVETAAGEYCWCACERGQRLMREDPGWLATLAALSGKPKPSPPYAVAATRAEDAAQREELRRKIAEIEAAKKKTD